MIHIAMASRTFCRRGLLRLSLRFMAQHVELAVVLMRAFGCRKCIAAFQTAVATASPIR